MQAAAAAAEAAWTTQALTRFDVQDTGQQENDAEARLEQARVAFEG